MRTKETNGALPSGDTAQAALLAYFIKYNFPKLFFMFGSNQFALRLIGLVGFARIFHHCHFIGDTLMGALLGFGIAYIFSTFNLIIPHELFEFEGDYASIDY